MRSFSLHIICLLCSLSAFSQQLTEAEKIVGLSTFWQEVNYNFAFFDQVEDLDWDKEYLSAIEELELVNSDYEYFRLLKKFAAKLNDGHTDVYYPDWIQNQLIYPEINIVQVNDEYFFIDLPNSLVKKIPIGSRLQKINGLLVQDYLEQKVKPYISSSTEHAKQLLAIDELFVGLKGEEFEIEYKSPAGHIDVYSLKLIDKLNSRENESKNVELLTLDDGYELLTINSFEDESIIHDIKSFIPDINKSNGLVIDLRQNIGGKGMVALNVAQYLLQGDVLVTMPWKSRQHIASLKAWGNSGLQLVGYETVENYKEYGELNAWINVESDTLQLDPRRIKVDVPVVMLIGEKTASAAENFLIYTSQNEAIKTVGTSTFGSTGQPIYFTLPGQAIARVCTKKNFDIDGSEFVGFGIQPDFKVIASLKERINKVDIQLEKALELLKDH